MDIVALKADIDATPVLAQAFADGDYGFIEKEYAKAHSTETKPKKYMFNKLIFYRNLGMAVGLPIIAALEAQTQSSDIMTSLKAREVLLLMNDLNLGGGVDASHPETHQMCDELVSAGAMAQETADTIKGWGEAALTVGFAKFGYEIRRGYVEKCLTI